MQGFKMWIRRIMDMTHAIIFAAKIRIDNLYIIVALFLSSLRIRSQFVYTGASSRLGTVGSEDF
jgi:hypothetical protein